ncbi:MAG: hypothetical protein A3F10_05690 [Coxiella sp. RIFCSPHIGHO2_12_FULL_42_15]|nr:MAG: hypothetical protein A3F10_05690 [Coxiella sp. RIFCSPHIGHO2_12_FULL_42_15]
MADITLIEQRITKDKICSFSDRVEQLLSNRGCTKAWLAKELNISRQLLNNILKNSKSPRFISEIALIFNVNPIWLKTGKGKIYASSLSVPNKIPLYNLSDVICCKLIEDTHQIDTILFKKKEEHHYFSILFNNYPSMEPKFEENSTLIFDKDIIPENKNYVLARVDEKDIVFRQYIKEKDLIILKALDRDYESIRPKKFEILGVLIETRIKF